jgi:triosephosphate isomerase
MQLLIAGNWKMNGLRAEARSLADGLRDGADGTGCDLLVCPPVTVLAEVAALLAGSVVAVGGQDCHAEAKGAHTGDVSAPMLRDAGAAWVILGHSERRQDHHETSVQVRHKAGGAAVAGLTPIVCVGETEAERESGHAFRVIGEQLSGSLPAGFAGVVAYEPIWAIGTGRTPTEADVAAMHAFIRTQLVADLGAGASGLRILYGGSVKPGNAAALLGLPEVGGALVGGASLAAADFLAIARASGALSKGPHSKEALSKPGLRV